MKLAFAAIMIRPRYLPDSIIAQEDSASAFLHSLDPKRKSNPTAASYRFSATTVIRSRPPIRLYDRFAPPCWVLTAISRQLKWPLSAGDDRKAAIDTN